MTRNIILVMLLVFGVFESAFAQVMTYLHEGDPAFSIAYPIEWDIKTARTEDRNLISAMPSDGSMLWQGVWIVRESLTVDEAIKALSDMEHQLFTDVKRVGEPWTEDIGALQVHCHQGSGLYKDSETVEILICVFQLPDNLVGAFAYMGDPEAISTHQNELQEMAGSLEAVE